MTPKMNQEMNLKTDSARRFPEKDLLNMAYLI